MLAGCNAMDDDPSKSRSCGFNESTKLYKANPTIENYTELRNSKPSEEIEIKTSQGIEFVFKFQQELDEIGIDPRLVCKCLDADENAQSELSILLLKKLIERSRLINSGETHVVSRNSAVSDVFVNYLIGECLDALSWNDNLYISRDLIVLIKHQLGIEKNTIYEEVEKQNSAHYAELIGAQLISRGIEPSFRRVADIMGVSPSTVKRWFPDGDFRERANRKASMFENGILKSP
jgi:hypothetical protein